ncbi:MAG: DUF1080 domain-containing protein [Bryobacterales bacterium]|nr:DUF1080 domain-containing protein [Bryobacterales bacterium]
MRFATLFAVACISLLAADANSLTPAEKAAGWRLLFDGKTLNGWEDTGKKDPPGKSWTIEDGCIKSQPKPGLREDLFTTESFSDFELVFQWKISPGGNSGLKYRIQDRFFLNEALIRTGKFKRFEDLANDAIATRSVLREQATQEYIVGFEYQVIDDSGHADARRGAFYQAGALYDMIAVTQKTAKAPGEFNDARIVVRGKHMEHWLNGVKVAEGDLGSPDAAAKAAKRWGTSSPIYKALADVPKLKTPIALQNHNDAAWFRGIKIRTLR